MSKSFCIVTFFAAMAAFLMAAAPASASEQWTLVQAVGEVSVAAPGAAPAAAKAATPLPDGATVRTGESGRAILLRGRETIVMSPLSALTLPSAGKRDFTKVRQVSGTLLFKIGKKPEAHFEVETPYLAAVVKGTTFTVKVASAGASVHVLEGAVEVATTDRKHSFLTRAGQISSVFAKAASDIFTTGASALNGPAGNTELWGTDVTGFEFGGDSNWSSPANTQVFNDTGLKNRTLKPKKDDGVNEGLAVPTASVAKKKNESNAASAARKQEQNPRESTAKSADSRGSHDRDREAGAKPAIDKSEQKASVQQSPKPSAKIENVWTITQAKGQIEIDGYPFTNFGDGQVRNLPPGTKVETGPDGRLGVAHAMRQFVIEPNTVVILADAQTHEAPKVVSGAAMEYREASGRYEPVPNLTPEEVASLRAEGVLDGAPHDGSPGDASQIAIATGGGNQTSTATDVMPRLSGPRMPGNTKTAEVRTKVISGLTLGLYGLTALLVIAFGAQWVWRRYRAKAKRQPAETNVQTRLRNIKGA